MTAATLIAVVWCLCSVLVLAYAPTYWRKHRD